MYYSVQSLAPSPKFDAYGQYIHQNKDVNITPSVSFKGFDISVSPADKYDKYNSTHASVNR